MTVNTDKLIIDQIKRALLHDPRVDAKKISIDIKGDTVILKGEVPSATSIGVAEAIAKKETGARIENHLKSTSKPIFAFR